MDERHPYSSNGGETSGEALREMFSVSLNTRHCLEVSEELFLSLLILVSSSSESAVCVRLSSHLLKDTKGHGSGVRSGHSLSLL